MKRYGKHISAMMAAVLLTGQFGNPAAMAMDSQQSYNSQQSLDKQKSLKEDITVDKQTFPDETFRSWILNANNLNGAGADGVLTAQELAEIREIDVSRKGIRSLKGIEVFSSLKVLNCTQNELTELDVSGNPELTALYCGYNALQNLSLEQNTKLTSLNCSFNRLHTLDVSNKTALRTLNCESNYLEQLNLKGSTELVWMYARNNLLTELDLTTNTKLEFVHIFDNRLNSIDVSKLSNLEFLHVGDNQLTALDLSHNLKLVEGGFTATYNNIDELKLPNLPSLTVYLKNYQVQNESKGYDRVEWYLDSNYTQKVEGDIRAEGQILYAKRIANDYKIYFSSNNGSGSMTPVSAVYGQEVTLPEVSFTRYGHKFTGWNTVFNGTGDSYQDKQEVMNISGKYQNDRITLHAQWAPIQYNVQFNANHENGPTTTNKLTVTYNQQLTLPANTFTNEGKDFIGWSREPGGSVLYRDQAKVYNLSAKDGETVTLYAVWTESVSELQKKYLGFLQEAFEKYSPENYTSEDWLSLSKIYSSAVNKIQGATTEGIMGESFENAKENMQKIQTRNDRVEEVVNGLKSAHSQVLNMLGSTTLDENNGSDAEEKTELALKDLEDGLDQYSSLSDKEDLSLADKEDLELVTGEARTKLRTIETELIKYHSAANWLNSLDGMTTRDLNKVTSADVNSYQLRLAEYDALGDELKEPIKTEVRDQLEERYQLADQKRSAVAGLNTVYKGYDLAEYSSQGKEKLLQALEDNISTIERASSESEVLTAHESGMKMMNQVPVADEEQIVSPEPNPDESTGENNGGSTGGSAGGSTSGSDGGSIGGGAGEDTDGGNADDDTAGPDESTTITVTDEKTGTVTKVSTTANGKVSANVTVPEELDHVTVTIPHKANEGTVAVLIKDDGTREIVRKSLLTDNGISVWLDGSAKLEIVDNSKSFKDVSTNVWYASPVQFAASRELFNGVGKDTFAPGSSMTRAMLATVLYRLENNPSVTGENSFDDVSSDSWYAAAVHWAVEQGITNGVGSGSFAPNDSITRESLAVMLYRYAQSLGMVSQTRDSSDLPFSDAGSISSWAKEAVEWAYANGILQGSNQMLRPGASSSRAEVATMLMRYVGLITDQT